MLKLIALSILLFIAILPVFIMLIYIYFTDKVDREPIWLIILLLFLGGLSTISAIIVETVGEVILSLIFDVGLGSLLPGIDFSAIVAFLECFFVIAVAEEIGKFIVMAIPTWKNKHFNYRFDGVVYCVTASLGFALVENILYVLPKPTFAAIQGGLGLMLQSEVWGAIGEGLGTGILRALTSIPGHTMFGVFMGLFYGFAKYYSSKGAKFKGFIFGVFSLIIPIVIHGFYDFLLSLSSILAILVFFEFIIVMYIVTFILTRVASKRDKPFFVPLVLKQMPVHPIQPYRVPPVPATYSTQNTQTYQAPEAQNYQAQNGQSYNE